MRSLFSSATPAAGRFSAVFQLMKALTMPGFRLLPSLDPLLSATHCQLSTRSPAQALTPKFGCSTCEKDAQSLCCVLWTSVYAAL